MNLLFRRHTRRHHSQAQRRRTRWGMSVVEIMVAMMLLGTGTVAMAGLSLATARRAQANDIFTKRTALLQQQMNRLQALPYDSLIAKQGTVKVTGSFPHTRVVSVSLDPSGNRARVTVRIIPSRAPGSGETIVFDRARPAKSPLCVGC